MSTYEESNIQNVELESVTNGYYGNSFIGYFTIIPQCGENSNKEQNLLTLKPYNVDKINETIKNITLPPLETPMISLSYAGYKNAQFSGIGDGEFGTISISFVLDRYLNNYTSFMDWSLMKYDWGLGGRNSQLGIRKQDDIEGVFVVDFINSDENVTRRIGYKLIIENLPSISLSIDNPEEIIYEITFKVTDIDISKFLSTSAISDNSKII